MEVTEVAAYGFTHGQTCLLQKGMSITSITSTLSQHNLKPISIEQNFRRVTMFVSLLLSSKGLVALFGYEACTSPHALHGRRVND